MDIRTPDTYKMETLSSYGDSSYGKENPEYEIEQAMLASLEEAWKTEELRNNTWDSFQDVLNTLKRIAKYDKAIEEVYELLSVILYKYSYHLDVQITQDNYEFIHSQLQMIRIRSVDKEKIEEILTRLRFSL